MVRNEGCLILRLIATVDRRNCATPISTLWYHPQTTCEVNIDQSVSCYQGLLETGVLLIDDRLLQLGTGQVVVKDVGFKFLQWSAILPPSFAIAHRQPHGPSSATVLLRVCF